MALRLAHRAPVAILVVLLAPRAALAADGSVVRKASLSGSYSYAVRSDGRAAPAFVQTNSLSPERGARFRWLSKGKRLRFVDGTPTGTRVVIARAVSGNRMFRVKKTRWELSLVKTEPSDVPALQLRIYEQGSKRTDFELGSANRKVRLELNWVAASTPRSKDGEVVALRNGKVIVVATELDNGFRLGAFALGMLTNSDSIEEDRLILFDDVSIAPL